MPTGGGAKLATPSPAFMPEQTAPSGVPFADVVDRIQQIKANTDSSEEFAAHLKERGGLPAVDEVKGCIPPAVEQLRGRVEVLAQDVRILECPCYLAEVLGEEFADRVGLADKSSKIEQAGPQVGEGLGQVVDVPAVAERGIGVRDPIRSPWIIGWRAARARAPDAPWHARTGSAHARPGAPASTAGAARPVLCIGVGEQEL